MVPVYVKLSLWMCVICVAKDSTYVCLKCRFSERVSRPAKLRGGPLYWGGWYRADASFTHNEGVMYFDLCPLCVVKRLRVPDSYLVELGRRNALRGVLEKKRSLGGRFVLVKDIKEMLDSGGGDVVL